MKRRNTIFLILFLAYLGAVLWCCFGHFSSLPQVNEDFLGIPTDKLVHCVMFLPFVFLSFLAFDSPGRSQPGTFLLLMAVIAAGLVMAVATEIGQSFTSYRSGDPADFLADSAGLALSTLGTLVLIFLKRKHKAS